MFRRRIAALSLSFFYFAAASVSLAQTRPQENHTEIILSEKKDLVFAGLRSGFMQWFYIPHSIEKPSRAELLLNFSFSDVLLRETSTITVFVNEIPVRSINLVGRTPDDNTESFLIDSSKLKSGMNSLNIAFYAQAHEDVCEDIDNPANWFVINKSSSLRIFYAPGTVLDLKYFPEPLMKMGEFAKKGVTFVLPEKPSRTLIEAYANFARMMGEAEPDRAINIYCAGEGESPKEKGEKESGLVVIGVRDQLPFGLGKDLPGGKDTVTYSLEPSPWSADSAMLSISSDKADLLKPAVDILNSAALKKELKGRRKTVDPKTEGYSKAVYPDIFAYKRTFGDFGYGDEIIRGTFNSDRSFYFTVPSAWRLREGASIDFKLTISQLLDPQKSQMSVFVNGVFAGSLKLQGRMRKPIVFPVKLPSDVLDKRSFEVVTSFYLDINQEGCERRYEEKAWLIIHKDSVLNLPHKDKGYFYLWDFPGQYLLKSKIESPVVIIPQDPTSDDLAALFRFAFALGQYMPPNRAWLDVRRASDVKEADKQRHLVVLGSAQKNVFFKEINPDLPISFSLENSTPFVSRSSDKGALKIPTDYRWDLPSDLRKDAGCLEIIKSAWNKEKTIMVITGTDKYLLYNALDVFANRAGLMSLDADVAMINSAGVIMPHKTVSTEMIERMKKEALRAKIPIFIGLVIGGIFLVVIILYFVWRRR